jgi:signal transduction histidine kinase
MVNIPSLFTLSFFTRLYISILVAIIFSLALTQYVVEDMMEQDAINDFVRDSQYLYTEINRQILLNNVEHPQEYIFNLPFTEDFHIRWLALDSTESLCQRCEHLGNVRGVKVFALDDEERLLAMYPIEHLNVQLIVVDKEHSHQISTDNDNDEEVEMFTGLNVEEAVFVLFILILLLIISFTIYWPVRQLQKQISGLVLTTQSFGAGKLDVRADELLAKPLNDLAHSFNSMAGSIADTVKENQIFAQAVPHEVRTPLSRIQLAAGILRKDNASEKQLALLDNIDTYIDDIDELIGQVVAFSKLNTKQDEGEDDFYQTIALKPFISARLQTFKFDRHINISLDIDETFEITTNPVYLRLLLDNLVKNALSHSQLHVKIIVKAIGSTFELSVEDDGPGVPVEFQETIFFPFARLDKSRSRKTGGLGLGLAIARAACKRMNGELSVKNNLLGGASFIVKFL